MIRLEFTKIKNFCSLYFVPDASHHDFFLKLFICFWLCWVSTPLLGLSLIATSAGFLLCGAPAAHCGGFSCCGAQALELRLRSCGATCGISPDQGLNPCPLHWQVNSYPLCHQESPCIIFKKIYDVFTAELQFEYN